MIVGASGFGREVAWLVERINQVSPTWNLLGFLDDNGALLGSRINGYPVLGNVQDVDQFPDAWFVCAIGSSAIRKKVVDKMLEKNPDVKFGTVIDPSAEISDLVTIGQGTIICAHTIVTVNIRIGDHVIMNLDCTVGHDAEIGDFVTMYPSVNVSGLCSIGCGTELGTGMQVIQAKSIGENTVIGAGSVVVRDIPSNCTAVGSPAKPIKFFN